MSEDETTTSVPASDSGSDATASEQPEPAEPTPAVKEDTTTESTSDKGESEKIELTSKDLKWAESKGIDVNNPSKEDVARLLKMQKDAEAKMTQSTQQASELRNAVNKEAQAELASIPQDDSTAQMQAQLQALQVSQAINDFYINNPEARDYDADMAKIVQENPQIAQGGLEAVYAVAKQRKMESGGAEELKAEGGKKALKELAQKQRAASPSASATNYETVSEVTPDEIRRRTAAHDLDWLRKNVR